VCGYGQCAPEWQDCNENPADGCETSLENVVNCGGCHILCAPPNAYPDCFSGYCQVGSCDQGFANCDEKVANGCEADLSQSSTCGSCSQQCSANEMCLQDPTTEQYYCGFF